MKESDYVVPCFSCGKQLASVGLGTVNQPYRATTFISYGQYGSTAYDPLDGSHIEINICDECLHILQDRIYGELN